MTVTRIYQPEAANLDELVDVLYELLTAASAEAALPALASPDPTCVSTRPE
jgi:hypothetical protein